MKRILFTAVALLVWANPAWATITLQQHTSAGSTNGDSVTTSAINTTTGSPNLIVIGVSYNGGGAGCTPTDSVSNAYTGLTSYPDGSFRTVRLWYKYAPTTNASHTFSCSDTGTLPTLTVAAFSGAATSPFDVENGAGAGGSETELATGSITPTQDNELIISVLSGPDDATANVNESMTKIEEVEVVAGQHVGGRLAYKVQTTATAINVTWSWTLATRAADTVASFKADAGGSAVPNSWYYFQQLRVVR